ncbi:probable G-protein coupled receptor 139 [Hemiscyllium ocellatum]|uniref:probable G-protein coupled receptor 139 n=1 Tax=Hemiscyllium ocellatum TaxID=170820 RepID=UPI002966CC85|nr:probable G-protein coupled receptor 139 [Hemiscyllium ocellatum]
MHGPASGPFYAIYYPALAAIGVPANLLAIVILLRGRCELSGCTTYYLVGIAVSDFLVIITGCILNRIGGIYFRHSTLSTTTACAVSTVMIYTSRDGSVWLTVAFTIDRFVAICCQSLKTRYCTEKTASLFIGVVCVLSCIKNLPSYFVYQPLYIVDGRSWFCDFRDSYYNSPAWKSYDWLNHILTPILPFLLILLLNAMTVRYILVASSARRRLRGLASQEDTEMANRKRSIILLFTISLSFLLLWVTYVGRFLYVRVTGEAYFSGLDFTDPQFILQETTNMLQILSSCNNVFIYAISQNKFRDELKKMMFSPFTSLAVCK